MLVATDKKIINVLDYLATNAGRIKFIEVVEEKSPYDVFPQGIVRIVVNGSITNEIATWHGIKGLWIEDDFGIHCSECWTHVEERTNYCPCCGTLMEASDVGQ